ncbi:sensor histidine kinase [Oscillospiraceae bacterium BX1]|uniref:histidine kinase n=1 Tax=Yanshouia hominis TaxID=2763673 RepID=A0ABR7NL00_9FIRM|nr:sensor histidine kinase [Yanshouia hominis]MBC8577082.1 sensor histidine kinase [Yanshouia hominis]
MMRRLSVWYRRSSIQVVISLSFTIVAVIGMILLGSALLLRFSSSTDALLAEDSRRILDQVNLNLDSYLRGMMRVSDTMYYRVIKNADLAEDSIGAGMNLLYETNRDTVVSIAVFSQNGGLVSATPLSSLKRQARPAQQEWFTAAAEKIENLHFSTPHVQNLFEDPDYLYRWVVSLSRQVELTRAGTIESGVLLVDMNFGGIEQICKDVDLGGSGYLYLIDGDGEIIYHPRQQLIYASLLRENNRAAAGYEDGSHREEFEGKNRQVTVKTVGYTGWKLVGVVPAESLASNHIQLRLFGVFIVLFFIFFLVFVNLGVSERIAVPIKALEQSVKELEAGSESVDIAIGGPYEVQHLGNSIRSMVSTMRQLMDDIIRQEESKRKSELDVLQSQINPHFLYNTLDSIVWMIENNRYDDAIVMVTSLARLFRISLSRGRTLITVGEELEHARHYMTIQKMRFKNKFTSEIRADGEALSCETVKLVVQPIVENAIYHGMEYADGDGEILVWAHIEGEDLYIDVTDNGPGMRQEQVDRLLREDGGPAAPSRRGSGIGLRNVHQRIQLTYGKPYGLEIESEPDEGTNIRIHLPVRRPGGNGEEARK